MEPQNETVVDAMTSAVTQALDRHIAELNQIKQMLARLEDERTKLTQKAIELQGAIRSFNDVINAAKADTKQPAAETK